MLGETSASEGINLTHRVPSDIKGFVPFVAGEVHGEIELDYYTDGNVHLPKPFIDELWKGEKWLMQKILVKVGRVFFKPDSGPDVKRVTVLTLDSHVGNVVTLVKNFQRGFYPKHFKVE